MTKRKNNENKRAKVKKKKKKKEEEKNTYIYIFKLLFMIRGMLSAYSKRKRYLLHFEFQN